MCFRAGTLGHEPSLQPRPQPWPEPTARSACPAVTEHTPQPGRPSWPANSVRVPRTPPRYRHGLRRALPLSAAGAPSARPPKHRWSAWLRARKVGASVAAGGTSVSEAPATSSRVLLMTGTPTRRLVRELRGASGARGLPYWGRPWPLLGILTLEAGPPGTAPVAESPPHWGLRGLLLSWEMRPWEGRARGTRWGGRRSPWLPAASARLGFWICHRCHREPPSAERQAGTRRPPRGSISSSRALQTPGSEGRPPGSRAGEAGSLRFHPSPDPRRGPAPRRASRRQAKRCLPGPAGLCVRHGARDRRAPSAPWDHGSAEVSTAPRRVQDPRPSPQLRARADTPWSSRRPPAPHVPGPRPGGCGTPSLPSADLDAVRRLDRFYFCFCGSGGISLPRAGKHILLYRF